ncbi:uncharacterized protein LOC135398526 [Ornithodoros turicata]|uniref:uncharacterized protein LOC135398526 n=1 Tax=Ornithodoros turicata TaxID=34597 RepID=UPI00313A15C7
MVERFHRRLKTALNANGSSCWTEVLPLVLLSLRATVKEDLGCTPAEMVCGATLRIPGDFFPTPANPPLTDLTSYVDRLRNTMAQLRPQPSRPCTRPSFQHPLLESATHVFVRYDGTRKPLQHPYDGPFRVIKRSQKHFTLQVRNRQDTLSIDRLKPAFLDEPGDSPSSFASVSAPTSGVVSLVELPCSPSPRPATSVTTRSPRHVRWALPLATACP